MVLAAAALVYPLLGRVVLVCVAAAVAVLVIFSALLDVGEVYSYSDYYKRAFWYFGDDLTTWISPLFLVFVLLRRHLLSVVMVGAAFLSGGRIGLLLICIQTILVIWVYRRQASTVGRSMCLAFLGGFALYIVVVSSSPYAIRSANSLILTFNLQERISLFEPTRRGFSDCRLGTCFEKKIKRPFRTRLLSSAAGLWMTLEGGFPGSRYPNSAEKFADLMSDANPWGINDRYGVSRDEWMRIGTIQSPYVGFGAGYGPIRLALVMGFIGAVCLVGMWNLKTLAPDPLVAFTAFFVVNSIFNQTQAWLLPGPVLFAMGLCGTHILWQYFSFGATVRHHPLPGDDPVAKED